MSMESSATRECPENHVPDLWFPDGNVIIRVGERICCVYKGFLATQSPVLSDMFSFPQPQSADTYLGLPTVTFPDAEGDVEHWLKALLIPGYFKNFPEKFEARKLLSVLRLSHKYDVQHFRRCALQHLAGKFATELDDHVQILSRPESQISISMGRQHHIDTYTLALEIGALWVIPSLCYKLHAHASVTPSWIDRITAHLASSSPSHVARIWKIGPLMYGKLGADFITAPLKTLGHTCHVQETTCAAAASGLLCVAFKRYTAHPFGFPIPESVTRDGPDFRICTACRDLMQKKHREMCEAFWETLPEELGLGTWAELRALKARDLGQSAED